MLAQKKEDLCSSSKAPSDQQEKCGFDSVIDFHDNLPCRGGKGTVLGRPHERPVAVAGPVYAAHKATKIRAQFNFQFACLSFKLLQETHILIDKEMVIMPV